VTLVSLPLEVKAATLHVSGATSKIILNSNGQSSSPSSLEMVAQNQTLSLAGAMDVAGVLSAQDMVTISGASLNAMVATVGTLNASVHQLLARVSDLERVTTSPPPPPAPPPAQIFSHLQEETYTGTVDCSRGTIQSAATAAGLPTGTATYTVLLEFKCSGDPGDAALYTWGSGSKNSINGLVFHPATSTREAMLRHYWYSNDLDWTSSSGMTISNICDGAWHTLGTQFDGTTRRLFFDGATVASDTPSGSHATINTNFCLGAEGARNLFPVTGSIRSFRVFTSGSIAPT